jgi:hypothetical protein
VVTVRLSVSHCLLDSNLGLPAHIRTDVALFLVLGFLAVFAHPLLFYRDASGKLTDDAASTFQAD